MSKYSEQWGIFWMITGVISGVITIFIAIAHFLFG